MKVILKEDVYNLGSMGDTVDVKPGYARNFLLPRKLAVAAESASAKQIEHEMYIIKRRENKMRAHLSEEKDVLEKLTVELKARVGESDKLFGSITSSHIAEALKDMGHEFDRRKIVSSEPIKTLGEHTVLLKLGAGVEAKIKVTVTAEEEPVKESLDIKALEEEDAAPAETPEAAQRQETTPQEETVSVEDQA